MPIIALGISHHTAPVTVRERYAFAEGALAGVLERLRSGGLVEELVILSTCNRVEFYASTALAPRAAFDGLREFLQQHAGGVALADNEFYTFAEPQSVEHLFKVACGLDSMVLGETEILGQLKRAYELAHQHGATGSRLNKAFQRAFNVAKQVRNETNIQRGSTSVAAVGVELSEKIFGQLDQTQVMVLGAGDTSEKAARALLSRGARSILVSNRSFDRAAALAGELGGRAIHFDQWDREFAAVDIVVSSTSAPHYILDRKKLEPLMEQRENRPLLLIDLAVPRDIDPEVNLLENVYLYNVDDLQVIANENIRQRRDEVARCVAIIREKAAGLLAGGRPPNVPSPAAAFGHD